MEPAKTVLVLEDEVIVAMDLTQTLEDAGYRVMGPFHTPETALKALDEAVPDCAVLDVNLGAGVTSDDVAARLSGQARMLFLTGYEMAGSSTLDNFPQAARLAKPLLHQQLLDWMAEAV